MNDRIKFRGDGAKRAPLAKRVPKSHPWRRPFDPRGLASYKRQRRQEPEQTPNEDRF